MQTEVCAEKLTSTPAAPIHCLSRLLREHFAVWNFPSSTGGSLYSSRDDYRAAFLGIHQVLQPILTLKPLISSTVVILDMFLQTNMKNDVILNVLHNKTSCVSCVQVTSLYLIINML